MVKFSGLLLGPLTLLMLFIRAWIGPWKMAGEIAEKPAQRFAGAIAICVVVALVSYAIIWAGISVSVFSK